VQDGDLVERGSFASDDTVLNVEDHFPLNQEGVVKDQCILGEVDSAFDGILDWDEPVFSLTSLHCVENVWDRGIGDAFKDSKIWLAEQCLLGEGSRWAKERNSSSQCRHNHQG
jgi:hypothetical protein